MSGAVTGKAGFAWSAWSAAVRGSPPLGSVVRHAAATTTRRIAATMSASASPLFLCNDDIRLPFN